MKVLHLVNQLGIGGTEKSAIIWVEALKRLLNVDVEICSIEGGIREDQCKKEGIKYSIFNKSIFDTKFDIVHMHRGGWIEHSLMPICKEFKKRYGTKIVETNIFGHLDDIYDCLIDSHLFVSNYCMKYYLRDRGDFLGKNDRVIYNPIREYYRSDVKDLREKYGIDKDTTVFGRIGRPDNFHGISIKAFELLESTGELKFKAIVLCPTDEMIEAWENNPNFILIEEPIIDSHGLERFYKTCDGMFHDRVDGETYGRGIAEAMAYGVGTVSHISRKYQAHLEIMGGTELAEKTLGYDPENISFSSRENELLELPGGYVSSMNDYEAYAKALTLIREKSRKTSKTMMDIIGSSSDFFDTASDILDVYTSLLK